MGRKRQGGLTPEDRALWAAYARTIRPLPEREAPDDGARPAARPQDAGNGSDRSGAGSVPAGKIARQEPPKPAGLDHRTRRHVTRGRVAIEDRIDLHGMRQAEAHRVLAGFIRSAVARRLGLVLVITGKGRASGDGAPWWEARETGVLRRLVPEWLRQPDLSPMVVGFEPASIAHGGEGAFYVRLRRKR